MHLVKQVVNKGVHEREAQGRKCGSVVQQGVMFGREMHGNRSHVPIPSSSIKKGDNCTGRLLLSPSNFISIGWQ